MEARVARLEAIIPTLATKEDLVKLELKIEKTIRAEITAVQQEIGGIHREIGNIHKDMGNLRGEMGKIEKTVATLVMKAMIAMVTISTALSTFAFMFAGK
jgi:predicted RNase H-like nuclease (RuvC/YqgF family)